jgi:hypothetical protein
LESSIAASAIFAPGRLWRVPTGSRSASIGGFFLMTSPSMIVTKQRLVARNKHTATRATSFQVEQGRR